MKPKLPIDEDVLLQEMLKYIPALYFPENEEDDTIHTLAREEFSRVQNLMRLEYDTEEDPNDSDSPFDAVEEEFEQAVYARIRIDPHIAQIVAIRQETIQKIREAVEKQNNIIGTFYQNRGIHFQHESESEEYDTSPIVVTHNPNYRVCVSYEANTVYELFIDKTGKLLCTLNGEVGEDFDEPIEYIQVEGLIEIAHWLEEHGFIEPDTPEQKYAAWQRGETEMHIVSIEIYSKKTDDSSSGSDDIFYDRKSALEYIAHYFDDDKMPEIKDGYFVCSIRRYVPSLEERQSYSTIESMFDLSEWLSIEPYYVQTVNK